MKNTIELAAEFIRRAAFVDANALLKDERVSKASIKSREEFRKWSDDYILGFFEGLTARHSYAHPRILGLLDGMKKEISDAGL
jgi:hypothetical protein